jgi:hypothetical protein
LWSLATVIYVKPSTPTGEARATPGDLSLSSELLKPGDTPSAVVDALIETWPACDELRPTITRLGAALTRLCDIERDEQKITDSLLHSLILPYIATSLREEEQLEALSSANAADDKHAKKLRLLQRRLC